MNYRLSYGVQICRRYVIINERKSSKKTPSSDVKYLDRHKLVRTTNSNQQTGQHFRSPNTHVSPPRRLSALASVIVFVGLIGQHASPSHCSCYGTVEFCGLTPVS